MNASFLISAPFVVVFFIPICQANQTSIAERGGSPTASVRLGHDYTFPIQGDEAPGN
jgi:hypothetical protein